MQMLLLEMIGRLVLVHNPCFHYHCQVVHSGFPDPPKMAKELAEKGASEEERLTCYRQVRDEIRAYVESLPESLNL